MIVDRVQPLLAYLKNINNVQLKLWFRIRHFLPVDLRKEDLLADKILMNT